jgi:hypothetical protein
LKKAIVISPPEAAVQIRNGNLTLGLTYAAIGLALIAVALSGIIDIIIRSIMS